MHSLLLIMLLTLHVRQGESVGSAIDSARTVWQERGETTVINIEPGTYYEELTIDVPHLTLRNASSRPSTALHNGGTEADKEAVRISWYCGHGYQYKSMDGQFNYGGKRTRRWNASVLVTAPWFRAENIIFENSFNQYVSPAELRDSLWDISQAEAAWTDKERPKKIMPTRPRTAYSTEVQQKIYNERASALSFTSGATDATLKGCRVVGHQDALYGDHGASVTIDGGTVQGTVDFIFGGMDLTVQGAELVIGTSFKNACYIAAGRGYAGTGEERKKRKDKREKTKAESISADSIATEYGMVPKDEVAQQGMVFENCKVRYATEDEVVNPARPMVYLARPWRWWGRHVFRNMDTSGVELHPDVFSLGLTKGKEAPWCVRVDK